ncbi:hypothetical protein [[Mycobacterium] nativiensis]|uniref:Uncharacterized protein n=1 Tax=[Mycobacterium] nativiensis TaxID=2855503 RepID=A0ABU5Y1D2_9MYCO|nr:hypothetical protein [Mycolicibacter sp. MYC340]MEB3033847.1 hypothetical protein [Mycolicibacter sp. MYC340]
MSYSFPRPTTQDDEVAEFNSGEVSLDDYLQRRALANHIEGGSRCFVTTTGRRAVGITCLAVGSVQHQDAPGRVRHFDFTPRPIDDLHLTLMMKDARALLGG